ncbi:NAD(P)/FAD-dependent oxidoreductase [Sphingomonas koreensis]|uniref:NAD(P)/FAD-dependent oxidoreductase n=1 Tax=Sphingomonas koreensis TaxID=93064 RepID=A0A430G1X0_9SPHN|nr:NAD(P)/FAD-dependent oxidoreductase [Sphingomonas koreensis]RSY82030.1 NAD(P)/FAD-dependent oxidoreductase [Sphingomonas koreensis]
MPADAKMLSTQPEVDFDVVVIGAGFAGVYLLHRLRSDGYRVRVFEAGSNVGGVWYWNTYPGARCDVESLQYSYSFDDTLDDDWQWSERFATQPEIHAYIEFVAERFDLKRDIVFNTRVEQARFDNEAGVWTVGTQDGSSVTARWVVMATGSLSSSRLPDIKGRDDFRGETFHTGQWPREGVDLSGKTVGVIGTGSSGIQAIPEIAKMAEQLYVFQRTPHFTVPARNAPLSEETLSHWNRDRRELRAKVLTTRSGVLHDYGPSPADAVAEEERLREYEARWQKGGTNFMYAYNDIMQNEATNEEAADFIRRKIREVVKDPVTADRLTPTDYPLGAKRICVDTDFWATFNRPNVELISLRETPIDHINETGVKTVDKQYDVDVLIFATGYDALTGSLTRIDIRGADGTSLKDAWSAGPYTYLGLMTANFPNMFIVTGPGSPSVLSNMVVSIEHDAKWIADALNYLREQGATRMETTEDSQRAWMGHVRELAEGTLYYKGNSWYLGANVPGKPRVFMPYLGGLDVYQAKCAQVAREGYTGFVIGR